ncbi:chimeric ERCC6-PGBD3 protein [Trichonephila inaurata madagascariensis]|uniref:Chimeric ERCC6-PGBD3 protein n=1 Tax=Trichonephila inaurata madagascariensis TaxID=2747483 RepID=A0A8X6MF26_9ARAC|nr:chimeric ERCC6-PGBD3 protein [Trichonephila inaurata madagascariensis]
MVKFTIPLQMARRGCREFPIWDDEILHLLMADNSDGEDELQLDDEDQQFQDVENENAKAPAMQETPPNVIPDIVSCETSEDVPNFQWEKNSYVPYVFYKSEYEFGRINLFSDPQDMLSPMHVFKEMTQLDQLMNDIVVKESIRYAEQNGRLFTIDSEEMKAFLGMNFVMSYHVLPTVRHYWSTDEDMGVSFIANVMPRKRFEQIRQNLHFCNNEDQSQANDKACKIRPVMNHFNLCFQKAMNNSKRQSIDEHMIKVKGQNIMKQYIKNKPIKWGFKMWCRADSSTGYLFEFDLYTGKKMNTEVELGESVVLSLTEQLKGLGCEVYFNDFFNSPALQYKLMKQNIKACGTIRTNRKNVPKSLPLDENMQRGDIHAESSSGISFIKWMDIKSVHMLTNFISPERNGTVKRRHAGTAEKVNVTCPEVVICYNKHRGGVDLMNQRKACYEVNRKVKIKYYLRLFFYLLDIALNNAYVVYVKLHEAQRMEGPLLSSLEYRQHIARGLINNYTCRQRPRPAVVSTEKQRIGTKRILPEHNMQKVEKMKRCANCAKRRKENRTNNVCTVCNVHLCFTVKRNCFVEYHN